MGGSGECQAQSETGEEDAVFIKAFIVAVLAPSRKFGGQMFAKVSLTPFRGIRVALTVKFALQMPSPSSRPEPTTSRILSEAALSMRTTRLFSTTELERSKSRTSTRKTSPSKRVHRKLTSRTVSHCTLPRKALSILRKLCHKLRSSRNH